MIILAGLSGLLGLIFYYLAMLIKEAMLTVRETRYMIIEVHDIIDTSKMIVEKVQGIVDMVGTTVDTVTSSIIKPVAAIGAFFKTIKGFTGGFGSMRRTEEEVVEEVEE
jgi:predicted RNA-binding protein with EMAP domain